MEPAIQFPSEHDVIREEVQRFQQLSDAEKMRMLRATLDEGFRALDLSPDNQLIEEQWRRERDANHVAFAEMLARMVPSS